MSVEILEFVRILIFSDYLARLGVGRYEADISEEFTRCPPVGRLEGEVLELDWVPDPVAELEVVGCVRCDSQNQVSEVLWIRTVTASRTQLQGLAHQARRISDFLLSLSLWVSWVILSLGKLLFPCSEFRL